MAAVIPEIAETAATAGQTAAGAGEGAAAGSSRAGGRVRAARIPPAGGQQRQRAGQRGTAQRQQQLGRSAKRAGRGALKARLPGSHSYQPVILAEFLVAVVVVAVGPIAKGGSAESQAKGSPSPYSVNTLKQLVAIGGVYFVLAILASSRRAGRYSAWFGGLVLIALGLGEVSSGNLQSFFKVFGPGAPADAAPAGLQDSGAAATGSTAAPGPGPTGT